MRWDPKTNDWIDDEGYSEKAKRWGIRRKVDLPPEEAPAPDAEAEAAEQLPALLDEFSALEAEVAAAEAALPELPDGRAPRDASSGRFGPGNAGKPKGATDIRRRRKRPNVTLDILADFHRHHGAFLAALRDKDPAAYLRLLENHLTPKSQW